MADCSGGLAYSECRRFKKQLKVLPDIFDMEKKLNQYIYVSDLQGKLSLAHIVVIISQSMIDQVFCLSDEKSNSSIFSLTVFCDSSHVGLLIILVQVFCFQIFCCLLFVSDSSKTEYNLPRQWKGQLYALLVHLLRICQQKFVCYGCNSETGLGKVKVR